MSITDMARIELARRKAEAENATLRAENARLKKALGNALQIGNECIGPRSDMTTHDYESGVHQPDCRWCDARAALQEARHE